MQNFLKSAVIAAAVVSATGAFAQDYPTRDITNYVAWSAGGGTDIVNRLISAEMQELLGVNINVTNRTGGVAGSAGMAYAYSQPADGYTLVGISSSNVTAAVQGGWDQKMDVWHPFIVAESPVIVSVPANSDYQSLEDFVDDARSNPGSILVSAGGSGGGQHLILLAFSEVLDLDLTFIPFDGSAPAQNAAVTGEVDVVFTLLAEQKQLLEAGRLRPLAMLVPQEFEVDSVGTIPSAIDLYPELEGRLPASPALAFAVRADAPDEAKERLTAAFDEAMSAPALQEWADENFYFLSGLSGEEAQDVFAATEAQFSWRLFDIGAVSIDPSSLGIERR